MIPALLLATLLVQAAPIDVGPNSPTPFALDFSGLKADGQPGAVVAELEFQFTPTAGPAVLVRLPFVPVVGKNTAPMADALKGLPEGVYEVRARWYDAAGQASVFSEPMGEPIRNTPDPPGPPLNVSVDGG